MLRIARTTLRGHRFSATHGLRYASSTPRKMIGGRNLALVSGGAALGLATLFASKVHADSAAVVTLPVASKSKRDDETIRSSFGTLVRTYVVYTMCSIPALVDNAPWLLQTFSSVPGVRWITEAIVRITFFDQFVGGDSVAETLPLLKSLRAANTGTLFAYSVEVDEAEATAGSGSGSSHPSPHKAVVDEMVHCIDVAADFEDALDAKQTGRRTWVAVNITALVPDASALIRLSSHIMSTRAPASAPQVVFPGNPTSSDLDVLAAKAPTGDLTAADLAVLRELHADMERICARAAARGIRIIIDAEYSWYQPAIDAYTYALMRRFNALGSGTQPLVYATFQAYLRRTPAHLVHALRDAKKHGYALGVKLVRGAYHPHEVAAHPAPGAAPGTAQTLSISREALPPVWAQKVETDATYDACAGLLLDAVAADFKTGRPQGIGILFGTHNWASVKGIMAGLAQRGLAAVTPEGKLRVTERVGERVTFGQLYGMCEDLTQYIANHTESNAPMVIKYVPYGALAEVMPYLSRRAIENKSVLGGGAAQAERQRAWDLIWQRIFG
ncbi:FAD-linked oxidoreductase-like protein [Mycena galopus ATCC 62051]|nr:FAD-linked oxidoreductase-like protein [Mycena galopus ATCC 62051]